MKMLQRLMGKKPFYCVLVGSYPNIPDAEDGYQLTIAEGGPRDDVHCHVSIPSADMISVLLATVPGLERLEVAPLTFLFRGNAEGVIAHLTEAYKGKLVVNERHWLY